MVYEGCLCDVYGYYPMFQGPLLAIPEAFIRLGHARGNWFQKLTLGSGLLDEEERRKKKKKKNRRQRNM